MSYGGRAFRHFTKTDHHGFIEDISVQIAARAFGDSRQREGFLQVQLDIFIPEGLKVRFVDS